ncbi:response regulator transcription factor [Desulfocurvus vexinensis]|uniref:response regulator transcription factor n=1 Tax=Desulfocurvus vexinensis TaxID=399548 RepID=UPI0004B5D60C|nr:response regulator transcription factor [Desulfocurvus vexinensis]
MDVLLIDDQPIVCRGAMAVLAAALPQCACAVAETPRQAEARLALAPPDLVLLDPALAGGAGDEVLRGIVTRHPRVPVLAFSFLPEQAHAARALRSGARGFVSKGAGEREFLDAVATVLAGRRYVSPELVSVLAARLATPRPRPARALLSARELEVARALARGVRLTDIARAMGVSVKTAGTYRTRALAKLHLGSNAELGASARALGLLDTTP